MLLPAGRSQRRRLIPSSSLPDFACAARRPFAGRRCRAWRAGIGLLALLAGLRPAPTAAHSGPPFALTTNQAAGPYTVTVWADPDLGGGQVLVQLLAPEGAQPAVTVAARPLDGHAAETRVSAVRGGENKSVAANTWVASLPFDAEGTWALTVQLAGAEGVGSLTAPVDVLPEGPTRGDAWLYVMPFALLAAAWLVGRLRHRNPQSSPASADTAPDR